MADSDQGDYALLQRALVYLILQSDTQRAMRLPVFTYRAAIAWAVESRHENRMEASGFQRINNAAINWIGRD
ncbi:hypothetical protein MO867_06060 [Microbulbifer sp. OS29]|uniref:Uncharacterized protein n=1 Tax=Microbulbifer okhotskensis TaxID=2926617 RepID=A0A9X2J6X3_9GAMM|nr:hypothetical protein [Microbulbifer okhotskensis]MCO1333901.1 hypothetical protein [Microbulbifer okhotskensis]